MKDVAYPAVFNPAREGGFEVTFPDFPEAFTPGDTQTEAMKMAIDCLDTAINWRIERGEKLPEPSPRAAGMKIVPVAFR